MPTGPSSNGTSVSSRGAPSESWRLSVNHVIAAIFSASDSCEAKSYFVTSTRSPAVVAAATLILSPNVPSATSSAAICCSHSGSNDGRAGDDDNIDDYITHRDVGHIEAVVRREGGPG